MGRVPARAKLPKGSPLNPAPKKPEPRQPVSVSRAPNDPDQSLAGGGAGGGKLFDPEMFRDEWRRSRDEATTSTVAQSVAEAMSGLDITLGEGGNAKAAVRQFAENLQRADLEHAKAPNENILEPYRLAFEEIIPQDPARAAFILESARLPAGTVSQLGRNGFLQLLADKPAAVTEAFRNAGISQNTARTLVGLSTPAPAPDVPAPAPASPPRRPPLAQPAPKTRQPVSTERPKPPVQKGDRAVVLPEPGQDWTDDQISRGYRVLLEETAPAAAPAPQSAGDPRIANIYIEREMARKQSELIRVGGPNSAKGKGIKAALDNSDAMRALARESAAADMQQVVARAEAAVSTASGPQELAAAQRRLASAQAMAAEHLASFDAAPKPSAPKAAPKRTIEILAGGPQTVQRATAAPAAIPPPTPAERAILQPERRKSLIERLRDFRFMDPESLDAQPGLELAPRDPLAPMGRRDFTTSLTHLLGYDQARKFYHENRPNNVPPSYKALVKQADNIDALARITGEQFVPQLPAVSTTVGPLNKRIAVEDLPANYKSMSRAEKKAAREALKAKSAGSTGDRAAYGVQGPEISAALALIDEKIPLQRGKRRIDMSLRKSGLTAMEEDYPEVVAQVREIMKPVKGGGPIIMREQVDNDIKAWERRRFLAQGRGRLTRFREQLANILDGKSKFVPKVLRDRSARATEGLVDQPAEAAAGKPNKERYDPWADVPTKYRAIRKQNALEFVQRSIQQGGIFPLDEEVPFWRGKYLFYDPDDGEVYFGRLTPNVLARTIMQMAEDTDPNTFARVKEMVRRSMEVYERLPIYARDKAGRLKYADESGAPRLMPPTTNYMKSLQTFMEKQGKEFNPIPRLGNPWDNDAPAPPPGRRFTTISPVTGLTK
jgi:hypothetical protein